VNYNPYQAPQGAPPPPPGPPQGVSGPQPWQVGEVIDVAWRRFKEQWATVVFAFLLMTFLSGIPGQVPGILVAARVVEHNSAEYWGVVGACQLLSFVIGAFFMPGMIRILVTTVRGQVPEFGALFGGADRFLPFLAVRLLQALVVVLGFVFFIVPGVILSLGLMLSEYYCVDAKLGPIESMKASWQATTGHKGDLFLLALAGVGLGLLGLLMCCVGILATVPIYQLAMALVYIRLSGRLGSSAPPGMPPPQAWGAPPGYPLA
jgi:hypothetical protein